jgi:hypothetical protein
LLLQPRLLLLLLLVCTAAVRHPRQSCSAVEKEIAQLMSKQTFGDFKEDCRSFWMLHWWCIC